KLITLQIDTTQYLFPNRLWYVKPQQEIIIKASVMVFVGVIGIFLNTVILTALWKNRWLWSASNYLIGNLALVDTLTLILCPWFMLVRDFYQNYVLRHFGCRFEGFMQANFLLYLNCAINPLIYGFTNTRFRNAMDRTPGLACFRFGYWCCFCSATVKKTKELEIHNPDRIYIIDNVTPKPNRKLSHAIKNFLHFNKHTLELSIPKVDEPTTKPTRVTPLRIEQFN
ncbi:unnamed protein product, partial [Leptidea sinapis]